jgi:DNA-binding transcriptional regulator YdaS (Cro superfamily)
LRSAKLILILRSREYRNYENNSNAVAKQNSCAIIRRNYQQKEKAMLKSGEDIKLQQRDQMVQLLEWIGSPKRLAATIGVTIEAVYAMKKRGCITKNGATIIHMASDGRFDRDEMRPDVIHWDDEV